MCKWLKNNFESYTYYYFVVISTLITTIILHLTNIDNNFFQLYEYNYASINTSIITVFGILFAFILTILAILFSLDENSLFFQLMSQSNKNKKDIINYFTLSILSLTIVVAIGFILTITYFGKSNIPATLSVLIENMTFINKILIYSLLYLTIFAVINVLLLIITFLTILKKDMP